MSWYRAGTVALTNGNATVTGTGTAFIANASIGEGFIAPDGRTYEITNIVSDTSLTISPAYLGSTASGQGYAIAPLRGLDRQNLALLNDLITNYAGIANGIGAGLLPNGTQSLPALRFSGDQDTGLRSGGANVLALVTGGVDALRVSPNYAAFGQQVALGRGVSNDAVALDVGAERSGDGLAFVDLTSVAGASYNVRMLRDAGANGSFSIDQLGGGSFDLITRGGPFNVLTNSGLRFVITADGNVTAGADNVQNLGNGAVRWATIFAVTGTINTSDEREKEWRGSLNEAELRAAKRLRDEIGIYQWKDSVAEKGEAARLHTGPRAQRVFAILEDEGLDWRRYAWCCHDKWAAIPAQPAVEEVRDKDGKLLVPARAAQPAVPAGDRYGIREQQFQYWMIIAQGEIQKDLEARIAALEAAK